MNDFVFDINYWGVLVATVVWFILGSVWYSPVMFSKPWMALIGKTEADIKKGGQTSLMKLMVISFILSFIEGYILAHFIAIAGAMTFIEGMQIGLWAGLGFIAIPFAIDFLYAGKPWKLYLITAGYQFVGILLMGGILAVMQ